MAVVSVSEAYLQFWDSADRKVPWSVFISEANAKLYVAAADQAARDATAVGTLLTRTRALSRLHVLDYGVRYLHREDTTVKPTDEEYLRGNKAVFMMTGLGGAARKNSIPGRHMGNIQAQPSNGLMVIVLDDGASVADWVTSMEAVGLDQYGGALTVVQGYLND